MFHLQVTSTTMKLLPLVCLCLLTRSGTTFGDENGPEFITVEEGSDVVLPCSLSTKENIELKTFDWKKAGQKDEDQKEVFYYDAGIHYNNGRAGQDEQFKGRVTHFQDELKNGNASITIRNTKVSDSGDYTCAFPLLQPQRKLHIHLHVGVILKDRSGENIPGAAPKPYVTILDETKDWSLLQCVVRGASPQPKVEWKDSSGNNVSAEEPQVTKRGGHFYITLQTTVTKTDTYSCVATQETINHQTDSKIHVYISGPEFITVEEGSDVVLPCSLSTKENIELKTFDWKKAGQKDEDKEVFYYDAGIHYNNGRAGQDEQFKGRVTHFQDELKNGDASITIRNTKVSDSGDYTCAFPLLQPERKFHIHLHVGGIRSGENIPGAAPKPYVTILDETKGWSLLQCVVRGASPQPKVEWKYSSGNIIPAEEPQVTKRGGHFYITLQTTVTKTDTYSCVATQETINHQTDSKIHVYISEPPRGFTIGSVVGGVVGGGVGGGVLGVIGVLAGFYFRRRIKQNSQKDSPI